MSTEESDRLKRQRQRSVVLGLSLAAFVVFVFILSIVRLSNNLENVIG